MPNPAASEDRELVFSELERAALVRELHVYGKLTTTSNNRSDGGKDKHAQHIGFGRRMMQEAERIAARNGYARVAVIAGIGTRGYYRKLGYELYPGEGRFMVKAVCRAPAVKSALEKVVATLAALLVLWAAMWVSR